jgi:hypothetical protein
MPPGFKLFNHVQPRPEGTIREDQYCFVSLLAACI